MFNEIKKRYIISGSEYFRTLFIELSFFSFPVILKKQKTFQKKKEKKPA
jgi:hypothetical protein